TKEGATSVRPLLFFRRFIFLRFIFRRSIFLRWRSYLLRHALLCYLATDFAGRIGRGVDVDVVIAGHEVGGLRVRQGGAALDRARSSIRDRNGNAAVLAGFGGTVKMRGGGGARQARIGDLPAQLLAGGIIVDVSGAGAGARVRRHLGLAVQCRFHLVGKGRSDEGDRRTQRDGSKHGLVRHGFLPVDVKRWCQLQNKAFSDLFPKRRLTPEISWKLMAGVAAILTI